MPLNAEPLALYVHWPWCLAKCPYCDFNSRVPGADGPDQRAYRDAILAELDHYAERTKGRSLASIFFGGGTPSLMDPDTAGEIIVAARRLWGLATACEITLEANPTSIETARFRAFRAAGVNRVSVGVQSLIDEELQKLGRQHSANEARRALDVAAAEFDRFTFDLIYARPGQDEAAWAAELSQALRIANGHISLYQLTVEPGTPYFRARVPEAGEDLAADLYRLTQDLTGAAGLPAYEISNHARPGQESRHNLTYWTGGDYLGIGPGAHGRLTRDGVTWASHQIADPDRWQDAVRQHGHGTAKTRALSPAERCEELLLAGLRLSHGIDRARFQALTGRDVTAAVTAEALTLLIDLGLVTLDARALAVTAEGRLVLGGILEKLLA